MSSTTEHNAFFIGGEYRAPAGTGRITVISPNTEEPIGSVPDGTEADIDAAVAAARQAFTDKSGWGGWSPAQRADAMERLADELDKRAADLAQAVSAQNGMPIAIAGQLEAVFPQLLLRYYAGLAREYPFEETRPGLLGGSTLVTADPVGVVGAIVPWNFPQALAAFKYAPGLAAGATFVFKPSPETVFDAYILADAVAAAGIPDGVINIVPGGREVGAYLVAHPGVDKVAFTGSTAAGRTISEVCGRLLRPVTLELGGKSAAIILDDADLDLTRVGEQIFSATLLNNGQTCFLGTRILAPRSRYDEVVQTFAGLAGSLQVGSALEATTQIGPMVSARQRERVESYIAKGKGDGATVAAGGGRRRRSTAGGSSSPPCSPASTTTMRSPRRRSSARCCRSSPTTATTTRWPSRTPVTTGSVDRCGPPITTTASRWRGGWRPARSGSMPTCRTRPRRSAVSSRPVWAGNWGRRDWPHIW